MHVLDLLIGKGNKGGDKGQIKVTFDSQQQQQHEQATPAPAAEAKPDSTAAAVVAPADAPAGPEPAASCGDSSTSTGSSTSSTHKAMSMQVHQQLQQLQAQQQHAQQHNQHSQQQQPMHPENTNTTNTAGAGAGAAGAAGAAAGSGGGSGGDSLKKELRKLLRRAAVSFRDLNISVHDASCASLTQMHDTATGVATTAQPNTACASVLTASGRQRVEVEKKKMAIIMVGLPGRGKTFVCNKLKCYLNWLGHPTAHFNVGQYRRKIKEGDSIQDAAFFDHNNPVGLAERERAFQLALADMMGYLRSDAGQVAIFDATNSTQERREKLSDALRGSGIRFIFIENICNNRAVLQQNYVNKMMYSPDYKGIPTKQAVSDFITRIQKYEEIYEPISSRVMHYIKLTDMVTGQGHIDINRISGYLPGKIVFYLMQVCKGGMTNARKIWLTRHGESVYNQQGLIGGDSPLSANGQAYGELLPDVILSRLPKGPDGAPVPVSVWTSTLQRTIMTAAGLPFAKLKWKALDEIDAGICDGMTYAQIAEKYPAEFEARKKDKLRYRYPRGESYLDIVQRLEPVISEMEREGESIVIVSHQAVLRVIFGYLMAQNQTSIPNISIPLHTVIELTPRPDGTMGVEYIPVPVHLSDASMLTTSMDALPASAAAAAAAGGSSGGGAAGPAAAVAAGSTGMLSGVGSPLSPADVGLDPAFTAAVGACPFKQDSQQGLAVELLAAAAAAGGAAAGQQQQAQSSAADASMLIGEQPDNSSSSHSTGTGCEQGHSHHHQQQHDSDTEHAESMPFYYYQHVSLSHNSPQCCDDDSSGVTDLPLVNSDELQRMSSCSSAASSLALMQKAAQQSAAAAAAAANAAAAAAAPAGCIEH